MDSKHRKPPQTLRERLWDSKGLRGVLVAFGVVLALLMPAPAASAAGCTDTERRNHMTCETNPKVSKCVLGIGGAGAVGFAFGGPMGFLGGIAGGIVGCAVDQIG